MKKRMVSLLLALMLCLGMSVPAMAADAHVSLSSLRYTKDGRGITITDCSQGARGTLEIPATIDGVQVVSIGDDAFSACDQITQVSLPNTVTNIGAYAFSGCAALTSVVIPDSVTQMGNGAFAECVNLKSVIVGKKVKTLPYQAFYNCESLSQVILQRGLETIQSEAFYNCGDLRTISFPNTLRVIGYSAFSYSGLTSAVMPSSMREINGGFFRCEGLKSIKLNDGLQVIDSYTFFRTALENVVIPDSVTKIGDYAFAEMPTLRSVVVGGGIKALNRAYFRDDPALETVTIREGVKTIGETDSWWIDSATFEGCPSLRTLYLPSSLIEIGAESFKDSQNICDIYYAGTAYDWGGVAIGRDNGNILESDVTMHYIPFRDTAVGDYYYDPMIWAIDGSITNGTSATTFSPDDTCVQAQILTFLYRAAKSPAVSGDSAYTRAEITPDKYYYNALLWAYQQGIVTNVDLNPEAPCTRADVVTYLWRLNGKPNSGSAGFTDVPSDAAYANAVSWAVSKGITNGTSATTFSPGDTCTRAQIVTFLYRNFVE